MGLPKTGLRKITVDGNHYEWTIRKRATSGKLYFTKKLTAAIQASTNLKRGLLIVDFGVSPPNTWRNPHKTSVTPKTIETIIRTALEKGWNPLESGIFEMSHPMAFVPDPNNMSPNANGDIRC